MMARGSAASRGHSCRSLLVFVTVASEADDFLHAFLLTAREEASVPSDLDINSKFFIDSASHPAQELPEIVAIGKNVQF